MVNAPPPNLMHGIQLVQAGRKAEALPYLRYAAQVEPMTAEGWLWLAAATDNLEEYRYAVEQALRLNPYHPNALRMRHALEAAHYASQAPPTPGYAMPPATPYAGTGSATPVQRQAGRRRPSLLRRVLRALVIALLLGGCIGVSASLVISGALTNLARDWLRVEDLHTLDFVVGDSPGYRFRVDVPDSWVPANTDNASWRATRDDLAAAFPGSADLWEALETGFSSVVRDPAYGTIMPVVRLVETGEGALESGGMVPALTLYEIVPLPTAPEGEPDTVCARMRALETQFAASGGFGVAVSGGQVVETTLDMRATYGDCVFAVERRYANLRSDQVPLALSAEVAPDATREIVIAVPVADTRYAVWQMVYPDAMHGDYDRAVARVLDTLHHVP